MKYNISKEMRAALEARVLSEKDAALLAGMTVEALRALLDYGRPRWKTLYRLAEAFNMDVCDFVTGREPGIFTLEREFEDTLRNHISQKGISITELAVGLCRTRQNVHSIINRGNPSWGTLTAICDALDLTVEEFLK